MESTSARNTEHSESSPESVITTLERKVRQLEAGQRRMRVLSIALLASGLLLLVAGWKPPDEKLESSSLTILDSSGRKRIVIGMLDRDPGIEFLDENGKRRACLAAGDTSRLTLNDADGAARILLVHDATKSELRFEESPFGQSDTPPSRVSLVAEKQGSTSFQIRAFPATCGVSLISSKESGSSISLKGQSVNEIELKTPAESAGRLRVVDEKGDEIWKSR